MKDSIDTRLVIDVYSLSLLSASSRNLCPRLQPDDVKPPQVSMVYLDHKRHTPTMQALSVQESRDTIRCTLNGTLEE